MKIPLLPLHIITTQMIERECAEKTQMLIDLEVMRLLTSDFIPQIEQLITARSQALIGRSAHGRRKARRKVFRQAQKLKMSMKVA